MSKTVDEKVVSMQFDNKNFEQNARTTMSTLDKLKQKLNLSGAAKGLNEVNAAAQKVNFNEIENAAYKSGFHIQDIWLKTASVLEYQVARKIVNAGKQMLSSLTVQPVGDGFKEYEMTLNAVQTTMAATGKTAEEVEKELKKLDEYADKTVYSTADMLNNLPKFTNAGVELEQATKAMIGIANATALAGGDASKASIAFYNLGQAIGTGYLTRMDYNSINNAGIATMEWKKAMVEAAIAQGTLTKVGENAYKAGKKTLTLQQLFIDGLQEQWATTDVMMKVFGDYGDETTNIGKRAYSAAQDIKTFTMMMDSLKATAGTGWKDTWQIIFGGLDEAKEFWTGLTNFIGNIINTLDNWRNTLLETALKSPFGKISEGMKKIGDTANKAVQPMKDLSEIVDRVINDEFGHTEKRWNKLTEMGYDWVKVQNLVNEKQGSSFRRQEIMNDATEEAVENTKELNDELFKEIGLTEDEIEVYKKLQDISKRTGIPIEEINGRMLLIESFKNIGKSLVAIFTQLKNAWTDTFSPLRPAQLLNLIDKFHQFTESLKFNHDQSYKLWRTFRGLFAILDLVTSILGGAFKIAIAVVKALLEYFNLDVLDVTASIGDAIVRFRNWLKSLVDVEVILDAIVPILADVVDWVRNLIKSIGESQAFTSFVDRIQKVSTAIKDWFAGMKDAENLPQYIAVGIGTAIGNVLASIRGFIGKLRDFVTGGFKDISGFMTEGFIGGIWDGIKKIGQTMLEFGRTIISTVEGILEIESPSKVFFAIAGFVVAGFILGFRDKIAEVWPALGEFADGIISFIKNIPFGKIFATAGSIAMLSFAKAIMDVAGGISEVLEGVGGVLVSFAYTTKQFGTAVKRLSKAVSNSLNAMAFKQFAISIAILVGAVVVLALIANQEGMVSKLWTAVGIVAALAAIMAVLFLVVTRFNTPKGALDSKTVVVNMANLTTAILAIAASMLLMALAAKFIGNMDWTEMGKAALGLIFLSGIMVGLMATTRLLATNTSKAQTLMGSVKTTTEIAAIGATLMQMAASLIILVLAAKMIASMDKDEMLKAGAGLLFLGGIMAGLMAATKLLAKTKAGSINAGLLNAGKMLLSMAAAMLVLVIAAKMIASMDWTEMGKAALGLVFLSGMMIGLAAATMSIAKTTKGGMSSQLTKIGTMLLAIAAAILVLTIAAKLIATMDWPEMGKAAVGILFLGGIMSGLVAATKLAGGNNLKGVAVTLLTMALVISMMAAAAFALSLLDLAGLAQGVIAMALLGAVVAGMVASTKYAKNVQGTMMGIAVAIAVMAAAIAVLSFIDFASLASATIALAIVMGMFLITRQAGKAKKAMPAIYALVAALAVMALAIGLLSLLPAKNLLGSASALSALMFAMAGVIAILGKTCGGTAGVNALAGVLLLTAIAIPLLAFTGVLALMSGVQNALSSVLALSLLATAMTALLIPLAIVGNFGISAVTGAIVLTTMALPLLAFVGVLALMSGVQNALGNVMTLVLLATTMTLLMIPLTILGALSIPALIGIALLTATAVPLIAFVGILAVMQNIQNANENANLLIMLMAAVTSMLVTIALVAPLAILAVAAIYGLLGVIVAVGVLAVAIGDLMTDFPELEEFLNTGLPILERLAGSIGSMIGKFVGGLIGGIADVLPHLGQCLSEFMINANPFIVGAKMVDETVLAGVGILAAAVLLLSTASLIEGITSFMTFGSSFADLGTELSQFMINAMPFITAAKMIDPAIMQGVQALASAILMLTGANILEGLTSWFTGGSSFASFGKDLAPFGTDLKAFSDAVAGINVEEVKVAAEAGKTLAEMAKTIPNEGGLAAWFAGDNSLASFSDGIKDFGKAIVDFSNTVIGVNPEAVKAACEAGKAITEMADTIPNEGGVAGWFAGENSLASFSGGINEFGKAIAEFSKTVTDVNPDAVKAACEAGKAITDMANTIPNEGGVAGWFAGENSLSAFGPQIAEFGKNLASFSDNVADITPANVTAAANAAKSLAEMANMAPDGSKLAKFGENLVKFGDKLSKINFAKLSTNLTNLDDVLTQLNTTGQTSVEFSTGAEKIVTAFVDTINDKKASLTSTVKTMASSLATSIRESYSKFKSAAGYLVDGFAAGITANTWKAEAKATAMANAALTAAKEALRVNSPSKVFRDLGMSVPEGFALGIGKLGGVVKNSAVEMADGAIDGTRDAIARIAEAVNSDIETQPTIRPVLDLSDIESGASSLSGMFGMTPSVGVLANVGAISSMMNNRQNGGNEDVVSALHDLQKSLGNRSGDSYNINGITYDDGTNVSEAVKTLVRAARIERRI